MALKIFATADLHIGMKFARYRDDVRAALVDARLQALERMVQRANEASCDIFAVAGDLFDRPNCPKKTVLQVLHALDRFEGALVALLPGNHDYVSGGGDLWDLLSREAGDRVLLLTERRPCDLDEFDLDAVLYPAPCTEKHSAVSAAGWITPANRVQERQYHVGLAHGSIAGVSPDFDGRYYPMSAEDLETAGMDAWIVGHTHVQWNNGRVYIPGTPEPDGFDCSGPGAAWLLRLAEDGVSAKPMVDGMFRFLDLPLEAKPGEDVISAIERHLPAEQERVLLRLKLRGLMTAEERDKLDAYLDRLSAELFYLRCDTENLAREITGNDIDAAFPEDSLPHRLLRSLEEERDPILLNLAWGLISEASE